MEDEPPKKESKPLHPLPGFCWMWMVGALFIGGLGGLIIHSCMDPRPELLDKLPKGDARWIELWCFGFAGLVVGSVYGWFWHRFAVERNLTRRTWHIGTGLILGGALFLFVTGWFFSGVLVLLHLPVWMQGHTRQFFDRA